MSSLTAFPIPLDPITDYIDQHGGLVQSLKGATGVPGTIRTEKPPYTRDTIERTAEEKQFIQRAYELVMGNGDGTINYEHADTLCCEHLGVHPTTVYGWAWNDFAPAIVIPFDDIEELVTFHGLTTSRAFWPAVRHLMDMTDLEFTRTIRRAVEAGLDPAVREVLWPTADAARELVAA